MTYTHGIMIPNIHGARINGTWIVGAVFKSSDLL